MVSRGSEVPWDVGLTADVIVAFSEVAEGVLQHQLPGMLECREFVAGHPLLQTFPEQRGLGFSILARRVRDRCERLTRRQVNVLPPPPGAQGRDHRGRFHDGSLPVVVGVSELCNAARQGDLHRLLALLAAGATVDAADARGSTPLHWAASHGHEGCVRALLAARAAVNLAANQRHSTPLHLAARNGHDGCVRSLLEAGAAADVENVEGHTPLRCAADMGHNGCVQALEAAAALAQEGESSAAVSMDDDNPGVCGSGEHPGGQRMQPPRAARRAAKGALREASTSISADLGSLSLSDASSSGAERVALQQKLARPAAQLLEAGWQSHTRDSMFLRAAGLAAEQLDSLQQQQGSLDSEASRLAGPCATRLASAAERTGTAAEQLEAALQAARQAYYQPQDSAAHGANAGVGGSGASAAAWSEHVSQAVRLSLQEHPAPESFAELAAAAAPPPLTEQFTPLSSEQVAGLGLQRESDASGLSARTRSQLRKLRTDAALPDEVAELLRSGGMHGSVLCEIKWRLHRVRLLTPPCSVAHSVNAAPEGPRLSDGDGVGFYVGRMSELDPDEVLDSQYIYQVPKEQVCPGAGYGGPGFAIDGEQWRNATAFVNCVFGSDLRPNLRAEPTWDPAGKLPHILLKYCGKERAMPLLELLLYYGEEYWHEDLLNLLCEGHREFAARATKVIAALLCALEAAGVPLADIVACLAPVDLTSAEHCFYRRAAGWAQQGAGGDEGAEARRKRRR